MTAKLTHALETRPAASFCTAALGFIVCRLYFDIEIALAAASVVCVLLILLNLSGRIDNFILILISAAVFIGTFSASNTMAKNEKIISELDMQTVRMTGRVASFPTAAGEKQRFFFKVSDIIYNGGRHEHGFKAYVSCDKADVEYGDILTMNARLYRENGESYILSKGAPMAGSCIELLNVKSAGLPWSAAAKIRNYLLSASEGLKGDAKGLFRALTAGDKTLISSKGYGELSSSGIAHIACISGLHISIIGMAVYNLFRRLNKKSAAALSVAAVFIFAAVSGSTPSALRAAMMYAMFIISEVLIRQNDSLTSLLLSALILALFNPYAVFDMSFILSYLSVLGMLLFSSKVRAVFRFLPKMIADSAAATVSAQMLTLPIILIYFKTLSVYSVLANTLISFIFPITLYMCFIMAAAAPVPGLSLITRAVCRLCLDSICAAAHLFASLPFGSARTDRFGTAMAVCYAVIVLLLLFSHKLSVYALGSAVIGCAVILTVVSSAGSKLEYSPLSDNSLIISSDETDAAVICDDLKGVLSELTESAAPYADVLLFGDCGKITAGEITGVLNITGAKRVCLPQEPSFYGAAREARLMGAKVEFYPETVTDLSEYARTRFFGR